MGLIKKRNALPVTSGLLAFFAVLLFWGCGNSAKPGQTDKALPVFFDLRDYFQKEMDYLTKKQPTAKKTVRLNGQESILPSAAISYVDELAPFANSDINKPSWKDKYQVDSVLTDGGLEEIRYMAKDASLKTRELRISFRNGRVEKVWIRNAIHSIISASDQELKYEREKGYAIKGRQAGRFVAEKRFFVQVAF